MKSPGIKTILSETRTRLPSKSRISSAFLICAEMSGNGSGILPLGARDIFAALPGETLLQHAESEATAVPPPKKKAGFWVSDLHVQNFKEIKMKKMVISVLLGLVVGLSYIGIMLLISLPFLLLFRMGILSLPSGAVESVAVILNLSGTLKDISADMGIGSLVLLGQIVLFLVLDTVTFIFMTKIMKIFLKSDKDFQRLYNGSFAFVFIVPEIFVILATFFNFPLAIALAFILIITVLVIIFSTVMATKILPDLMKNQNRKYILKTNVEE